MPEVEAKAASPPARAAQGAGPDVAAPAEFAGLRVRLGASSRVKVLEIDSDGAVLEAKKYLRIGSRCTMAVKGAAGELNLEATVSWSRLVRTEAIAEREVDSIYRAGLAFVDLPKPKSRLLETLIAVETGAEMPEEPSAAESTGREERASPTGGTGKRSPTGSVLPFLDERDRRARDARSRHGFVRDTRETFDRLFGDEDPQLERCADER